MSIYDLNAEEKKLAGQQGWGLFTIFDEQKGRWYMGVLPLRFTRAQGARQATEHVLNMAKTKNAVCLRALQLLTQFNSKAKKK